MVDFKSYFKGKKITVMGLGLLGRGVGDVAFLAECGAELTVTDLKPVTALSPSLAKLRKFKNIKYILGEHRLEDFQNCDFVLKAAGVPLDSIYIKEAKKNNIPIEMSATLFAKLSGLPIVAVTGTRGKSTVTHLIAHILESAGKKIILGGNVRGVSNLQLLKKIKKDSIAVFELDSWQLQGFGEMKISPDVAVFTTFFPDHMKYYDQDMKKYFSDKANIFKYQKKEDILVVGAQAMPFVNKWGGVLKGRLLVADKNLPKDFTLNIPGEHNIYNASLAVSVARVLGVKDELIKKSLKSFKGVSGRLEFVRNLKGVKYYNDTTATTPEATIAALIALTFSIKLPKQGFGVKKIILIMGGSDKGLDMSSVVKEILKFCKEVVLLSGSGTDSIKNKIKKYKEVSSMGEAVKTALGLASRGDTILLSPAFASFGMFENEYDRGDQFLKLVKKLK